jgi:hypothetical protein
MQYNTQNPSQKITILNPKLFFASLFFHRNPSPKLLSVSLLFHQNPLELAIICNRKKPPISRVR